MRVAPRIRRWLSGPGSDPSVRYRYLVEVEGRSPDDAIARRVRKQIGREGWAASLLAKEVHDGRWVTPGTAPLEILRPRFASSHWVAVVLADLGMTRSDPRVRKLAEGLLRWRRAVLREKDAELCFGGNATRTLIRFGYLDHPVVQGSIEWLVRTQKSDGGWTCFPSSRTGSLDGWEGLAALAEIPETSRDAAVRSALERGAEFYLHRHLMDAPGPRYAPWFRIHYPNHYYYDLLVGLRILTKLGYGRDSRLRPALRWLRSKRRADGAWALDGTHPTVDDEDGVYVFRRPVFSLSLEAPTVSSRWATVEALSILRRVEDA